MCLSSVPTTASSAQVPNTQAQNNAQLPQLPNAKERTVSNNVDLNNRPDYDVVIQKIVDYVLAEPNFSAEAMKTMSTRGMTFLLDVPRVAHGERVFSQMIEQARKFAEVLHGAMVDDNRRPLSEVSLEPIRRQIGQYQEAMSNHQIPAGSPQALRLFS